MTSIADKLSNVLEDPTRPYVGRNIKLLKMFGLILPKKKTWRYLFLLVHTVKFLFIVSQYIDIYMNIFNLLHVLRNIKYTIFATVNVVKVITYIIWEKRWESVHQFVMEVHSERSKNRDKFSRKVHDKFTLLNKFVTYLYFYFTYCTMLMITLQPLAQYCLSPTYRKNLKNGTEKRLEIVNSWLPINKDTTLGYSIAVSIQVWVAFYAGGWISSYDTNVISLMIFIRTESELLRRDCQLLFGTEDQPVSEKEAKVRLAKCHKRHNDLLVYTRIFDSCLSPVMLLYVIMCSCMLCATAYQFTIETSAMQKVITAEYLVFAVSQLFLYCWHSNDVFYFSKDLMQGPYESIWWTRSLSEQKHTHILTSQFNTILVFSAGPFTNITVTTFINILKGAYSYYTLLSQSQEH